ncbi:MAG: hypothetical protein HYV17_11375 [Xanthomonadales bacterium]|nr:hypothetical protein [Xanthomonadales bacterium]
MPLKICDALLRGAKAGLNHLYTVPPLIHPGGWDAGWYCREHALHVGALAEMMGHRAELCGGDLVVDLPADQYRMAMVSTGADHFWCKVDDQAPIDASLTLRHLDVTHPDVALIASDCPEHRSGFELRYTHRMGIDNLIRRLHGNERPVLHYNVQDSHRPDYAKLLDAPYGFLIKSQPTLLELHGADVMFAITAYLFRLAHGELMAVDPTVPWSEAMRRIVHEHGDARPFVLASLDRSRRR